MKTQPPEQHTERIYGIYDFHLTTYSGEEADIRGQYCNVWFRRLHRFPGIATRWRWPVPWVMARHWLVVTIFGLFNGVLMWVYRKRGKELANNE